MLIDFLPLAFSYRPCDQRAMTDKKLSYTLSKVLATEPLITEIQARQKPI
jgi:hypothetical protein